MTYKSSHKSIFLNEFLELFSSCSLNYFVDGTLGAGGHSEAILEAHPEIQRLFGIDGDTDALELAQKRLARFGDKVTLIHGDFRNLSKLIPVEKVQGIFYDIGLSSMQIDEADRGFSFAREAPLDMRRDTSLPLDAKTVINTFPEKKLGEIFRDLGEEPHWRKAAKAIVDARRKKPIKTTTDLAAVLENILFRRGHLHPLTLVFQGLRIFVNDELKSLEEGIIQAIDLLDTGGRFGVIAFHSLEDRIVKNLFRDSAKKKETFLLTKKPLIATREEIRANPRSRSAKLRFIEKL